MLARIDIDKIIGTGLVAYMGRSLADKHRKDEPS